MTDSGSCGNHPGMSCSEAHLDDSMKIAALTERVKDSIPWEHSPSDVCRFCGGDIRYHDYDSYAQCKQKEIASLTERVKELEKLASVEATSEILEENRQLTRQLESLSNSKTGVPCKGGLHYCRCGVTLNVGYLQKTNRRLSCGVSDLTSKLKSAENALAAEKTLRVNKYANAERLIEWMDDPNRKPANTSFTEGPERQIAYRFERKP